MAASSCAWLHEMGISRRYIIHQEYGSALFAQCQYNVEIRSMHPPSEQWLLKGAEISWRGEVCLVRAGLGLKESRASQSAGTG
jgi:hypothetical protein